ncbi:hypothetical protein [Terrisporobacter sp.]
MIGDKKVEEINKIVSNFIKEFHEDGTLCESVDIKQKTYRVYFALYVF